MTLVHAPSSSERSAERGRSRRSAAFTLVELLTVIAIIVLLVGITIGVLGYATKRGAQSKAEGQLELLVTGLERYKVKYGSYPEPVDNSGEGSGGAKALYQALSGDGDNHLVVASSESGGPSKGEVGSTVEPLVEGIDPNANKHGLVNTELALVDPFGQYWHYRIHLKDDEDPTHNKTFDLWSVADDRDGTEARWVKNW